jgi:hypothetical protein
MERFVDKSTGEVIGERFESKKTKIIAGDRDEYFMIYSSFISVSAGLTPVETKVFLLLLNYSNSANSVGIAKADRILIAEKLNATKGKSYSEISVFRALRGLVEKKVLIKKQKSFFKINPRYFWRGSYNDRIKALKYTLEVECPDC